MSKSRFDRPSAVLLAIASLSFIAMNAAAQTVLQDSLQVTEPVVIPNHDSTDMDEWLNNRIWNSPEPQTPPDPAAWVNNGNTIQYSQEFNPSQNVYPDQILNNATNVFAPFQSDIDNAVLGSEEELGFGANILPPAPRPNFFGRLWQDELHFYSPKSLSMIGGGLLVGAAFANTNWDSGIQSHIQSSLKHANTDDWLEGLHANKEFGDGRYTLPVFASAWAVGKLLPNNPYAQNVGTWGDRSIRGFVVGAPAVLVLQMATGGSRPGETNHGSEWEPFQDSNGVSGHAFMGALPFITAAKMTESRGLKTVFYAASTLAPLSRTGDGAHYPSQVMLGWWMAYVAASAVQSTDRENSNWRLIPTATPNSTGMAFEYKY